ncbi:SMI1/KNR4 family protein [Microvirga makkahensis]|uniref:SMI1/KNR4 family protein n=1 Tax=Microvirga makkahensis TaxID=1128670 RepID=UPI003CCE4C74
MPVSPSYRDFLLRYGCGDIRGQEFYGITHGDFDNSGIPNGIWVTLKERQEGNLPRHLLVVHALGEGSLSCIDFSRQRADGECPVVVWELTCQATTCLRSKQRISVSSSSR